MDVVVVLFDGGFTAVLKCGTRGFIKMLANVINKLTEELHYNSENHTLPNCLIFMTENMTKSVVMARSHTRRQVPIPLPGSVQEFTHKINKQSS